MVENPRVGLRDDVDDEYWVSSLASNIMIQVRGYKQINVVYFENSTCWVCVETLENHQTRAIKDVPFAVHR